MARRQIVFSSLPGLHKKDEFKNSSILPCASIPVLQSNHSKASKLKVIDSAKLKQPTEYQEKAALHHDNNINNMYFESQNYTNFADEEVTESVYKNNRSSSDYSQEQLYLVKKEEDNLAIHIIPNTFGPKKRFVKLI